MDEHFISDSTPLFSSKTEAIKTHEEQAVEAHRSPPWGRGIPQAVFNLVNTTIGAGVLGLPKVMGMSGLGLGLVLISAFAVLSNYTLRLLHQVSLASHQLTYEDAAHVIWDKWLALAVKIAVGVINFGGLISYLMICGDFLHPVLSSALGPTSLLANRTLLIGLVTLLFILPLSMVRNISSLQYGSLLSIVFSLSFTVIVAVRCFSPAFRHGDLVAFNWSWDVFQSVGMVLFAFSCHTNLIPVSIEMYQFNTVRNLAAALYLSTTLSYLCYAATATFGYLSFYQDVDGNILNNYPADDVLVTVMRVVLTLSIILTFPLALFPCRLSLDRLIFPHLAPFGAASASRPADSYEVLVDDQAREPQDPVVLIGYVPVLKSTIRFVVETLCIVVLAFLLAIFLPGVDVVFALVGSSGSACTGYIFPAILWFKARQWMPARDTLSFKTNVILTPIVALLGVLFGILGTTMTILGMVNND